MRLLALRVLSFALFVLVFGVAACEGCKGGPPAKDSGGTVVGPPTARLYVVSDLAGALEPCGCTKDQLGGVDHFAALVAKERASVPSAGLFTAGPLFFMDLESKKERGAQDDKKANAIARSMKRLGLLGFAPSENERRRGARLSELATLSGAPALGADLSKQYEVVTLGGLRVGVLGLHVPKERPGREPPKEPYAASVRRGIVEAKRDGAQLFVLLASMGRGEAKRIADEVPELFAMVVGAPEAEGETNTPGAPAERVNGVLLLELSNHLQRVGILDLFVRDGQMTFADASGLEQAGKRAELTRKVDDLRIRIAAWQQSGKVSDSDLDARKRDLELAEAERRKLDEVPPPPRGSFFRYTERDIRDNLGKDPEIAADLVSYYKEINEHNRKAFADRKPPPVAAGQAGYAGGAACATCHPNAKKFWDTTPHARAYKTLADQSKEFNLECVSCHVTGYERPGGSTVTFVDKLRDVQCEVCHGPGTQHIDHPTDRKLLTARPSPQICTGCHFPPHVEKFDAPAKMSEIVGPGHGRPMP